MVGLARQQQIPLAHSGRSRSQHAFIIIIAQRRLHERRIQFAHIIDARRTCRGKVPIPRIVSPLAVLDAIDQFRDQKVEVGITLAVRMSGQVHRHAHQGSRKIRAVIQVETAQVILVRFAIARMLADDQTGYHFHDFSGAQYRAVLQLFCRHRAFAGSRSDTQQIVGFCRHLDFIQRRYTGSVCSICNQQQYA